MFMVLFHTLGTTKVSKQGQKDTQELIQEIEETHRGLLSRMKYLNNVFTDSIKYFLLKPLIFCVIFMVNKKIL